MTTKSIDALAVIRRHAESHRAMAETDAYSAQEAPRLEAALAALEDLVKVAKLFDALYRPDEVGHMAAGQPDSQGIYGVNGSTITLGDFRKLRASLARVEGATP